jgi:hypothetical protein
MAEKSIHDRIAELEAELAKLREEEAKDAFQEYPKFLPDLGLTAESAEQEKAIREGKAVVEVTKSAAGETKKIKATKAAKKKAAKAPAKKKAVK